jgi:ribonuclease BN (tRNA processing enzyme)
MYARQPHGESSQFEHPLSGRAAIGARGCSLHRLRHVFITHQHSDHNAEYGAQLLTAWGSSPPKSGGYMGPPPMTHMTELFLEMNDCDIRTRMDDVCSRGHPPIVPAFPVRIDSPDRSIAISGDTKPCDALIRLARDADVLVHEVLWPSALDRLLAIRTTLAH